MKEEPQRSMECVHIWKKAMAAAGMVILCAGLTGCGQKWNLPEKALQSSSETITLRLANNLPENSATTKAVEWFGQAVEARTDGRIRIEIFNDAEMGDGRSCLEQVQYGGVDIVKADLTALSNFVEEFGVLAMPYIYRNTEHFWKVHTGPIGEELLHSEEMTEQGMYGLTYYDGGTRCFYNTKGEIHRPSDMEGMGIRVQPSEIMMFMVKALGARPIMSDYSQVYRLLQTGEAQGAENSIVNYYNQAFYEVAPYFVQDNHTRSADILVMGTKSREKLTKEDLEILDQAAKDSCEYQRKLWEEAENQAREELLKKNVVFTELSAEEYEQFRCACEQIWYSYREGRYIDLIDQIVAAGYQ